MISQSLQISLNWIGFEQTKPWRPASFSLLCWTDAFRAYTQHICHNAGIWGHFVHSYHCCDFWLQWLDLSLVHTPTGLESLLALWNSRCTCFPLANSPSSSPRTLDKKRQVLWAEEFFPSFGLKIWAEEKFPVKYFPVISSKITFFLEEPHDPHPDSWQNFLIKYSIIKKLKMKCSWETTKSPIPH